MEDIYRKNSAFKIVWCGVLAAWGVYLGLAINANSNLARFYNVTAYMITEFAVTGFTLVVALVWWHYATSESVKAQDLRMWISEHGATAHFIFFIFVWLFAAAAHMVCSAGFTLGTSGYRIYSVFTLPFLYMALSYLLPPVEISETILPGSPLVQKIARGIIVLILLGVIGVIAINDLS